MSNKRFNVGLPIVLSLWVVAIYYTSAPDNNLIEEESQSALIRNYTTGSTHTSGVLLLNPNDDNNNNHFGITNNNTDISAFNRDKIVLVIVVCPPPNSSGPRNEAAVLLKSAIISAKVNKIKAFEVHYFFEMVDKETKLLMTTLKEFGYPFDDIDIKLHFHSAMDAVPKKYQLQFIKKADNNKLFRCTNVRIFFPSVLKEVDSILYLDTDVILHGNMQTFWNIFKQMDDEQLIGVSSDYEERSSNHLPPSIHRTYFRHVPYPQPAALNAGVLMMNLTRMRDFDWESKLLRIWNDYYKIVPSLNDQHIINIMLYYNPDLLFRVPCQFNYLEWHCDPNYPCKSAEMDGVQVIHGAANKFTWVGEFRNVFLAYKNFDMKRLDRDLDRDKFRVQLREDYQHFHNVSKVSKNREMSMAACHAILSKLL